MGGAFWGKAGALLSIGHWDVLNSQMNLSLAAEIPWELGAEERVHPSLRLGGKGYQTPSEVLATG